MYTGLRAVKDMFGLDPSHEPWRSGAMDFTLVAAGATTDSTHHQL